jgi:hypothetical protein
MHGKGWHEIGLRTKLKVFFFLSIDTLGNKKELIQIRNIFVVIIYKEKSFNRLKIGHKKGHTPNGKKKLN